MTLISTHFATRVVKFLWHAFAKTIFSITVAVMLCLAVDGVNDWGDAPGGGFLIIFLLAWALVSAFIAAIVSADQLRSTVLTPLTSSLPMLLASNCLGASLICILTTHERCGWVLLISLLATVAISIALCLTNVSGVLRYRTFATISMPFLLLLGSLGYGNVFGGRTLVRVSAPDGDALAEVSRTSGGDCVLLSGSINPLRTCIFESRGGTVELQWTTAQDLKVMCRDCAPGITEIDNSELKCTWRRIAIHYEFLGLSPLTKKNCTT